MYFIKFLLFFSSNSYRPISLRLMGFDCGNYVGFRWSENSNNAPMCVFYFVFSQCVLYKTFIYSGLPVVWHLQFWIYSISAYREDSSTECTRTITSLASACETLPVLSALSYYQGFKVAKVQSKFNCKSLPVSWQRLNKQVVLYVLWCLSGCKHQTKKSERKSNINLPNDHLLALAVNLHGFQ